MTGLNEAKDASSPSKDALVGVQKIAAANSNTATRHILQGGLYLSAETSEAISLRVSDIIEYSPARDAFIQSIGAHNVATLSELENLHLYDFGIFLELTPDDEEKQMLENNIQMALTQQNIELEDAIDLREIKNVKLANQLLKIRRKKKLERDQANNERNIQAQAEANAQAQEVAAQAEVQKNAALTEQKLQLAQTEAQIELMRMAKEVEHKKALMNHEFQINKILKGMEFDNITGKEKMKEDRKDERTRIQATQQSKMIDQRNKDKSPENFESSGNDIMGGGFGLNSFDPR